MPEIGLIVAALGGAAIGLEREWSGHASGPKARFGGIRTFTLLGGLGGVTGDLAGRELVPLAAVLLAGAAALVVAAYAAASREDVDGTTEVAALVVLAAGVLSGSGQVVLGSAVIAAAAALLLEKSRLHAFVNRIDDAALRASVRFAVLACVVLPLLPAGPYGPYGAIRPRELWALVLFFSGLSFVGWLARRAAGPHQGAIVSGVLGGILSSTSVTLTFARESRSGESPRFALAIGAIGACTMMFVRVAVACAVLNPALALELPRYVFAALAVGVLAVLAGWRAAHAAEAHSGASSTDSPLQVRTALQMAALFQVVLLLVPFARHAWGSDALVATSVFVGLTDLDALTLSLARNTAIASDVPGAGVALVAGILSNTVLKMTVAVAVGRGRFRLLVGGALATMALAMAAALVAR